MKKEAHALRFNIYLNEDIAFDKKTVYLSSEQEGYDSYMFPEIQEKKYLRFDSIF